MLYNTPYIYLMVYLRFLYIYLKYSFSNNKNYHNSKYTYIIDGMFTCIIYNEYIVLVLLILIN